jgi:DNA polymerase III subunit delta
VYNKWMAFAARGSAPRPDPIAAIARGELDPIYCFHGAERFLVDRCLQAVRQAVGARIPPAFAAFNVDSFDLREVDLATVVQTAKTLPMMSPIRLVVAKSIDAIKADALAVLLPYLADPNPRACLVLVGDKVEGRFKAFQALKKAGFLHELLPLRDRELPAWVAGEARQRKIAIRPEAAAALADLAGPELGPLSQALEQLGLYVGVGQTVGLDDVEALIAETRQRSVFELTRAIAEGDVTGALIVLANMFRNREPPLRVQFMLARQLRQIWKAKALLKSGVSRDQIAAAVGVPPFFVDDVLGPARRMTEPTLARGLERLFQADRALKSSRIDGEILLSRLVQQIAIGARGARPAAGAAAAR